MFFSLDGTPELKQNQVLFVSLEPLPPGMGAIPPPNWMLPAASEAGPPFAAHRHPGVVKNDTCLLDLKDLYKFLEAWHAETRKKSTAPRVALGVKRIYFGAPNSIRTPRLKVKESQ